MSEPVKETRAMIAAMAPELQPGLFLFCSTDDPALAVHCLRPAIAMMTEAEGLSFILPVEEARMLGFDSAIPMRQITLTVHSALDGVGLTAAVAGALADHGIACNMVAGFHHDHIFVPEDRAGDAMAVLRGIQRDSR